MLCSPHVPSNFYVVLKGYGYCGYHVLNFLINMLVTQNFSKLLRSYVVIGAQ